MSALTAAERQQIIDQALVLMEHLYVHLPLKRAMHAVDPIQRLRLLRHRSEQMGDRAFHDELISIFTRLRDLHTNYILPEPLRSRTAYLPFRIEECFEGDQRLYVVTQIKPGAEDATFKPGVLLTHWNGVPIHRAVELNADREAGSNLEARHARGLAAMTIRSMAMSLPPDEEWVTVNYLAGKRPKERKFEWQVIEAGLTGDSNDPLASSADLALVLGIDVKAELERLVRKRLFAPEAVAIDRQVTAQLADPTLGGADGAEGAVDFNKVSKLPDVFTFRSVKTSAGTFGYVRIQTFYYWDDVAFVNEFVRIVELLPQDGLILDVRGNGGGNILAGERLLQILTPQRIDPERFYFINSPLTLRLCAANDFLSSWKESISQAVETGAAFSHGFPLRPVPSYNDIGQKYQGPVVLVTDARCYSTTDIFSAGFQDHTVGKILGTSGATGAGGANVWDHDTLIKFFPKPESPFIPLPKKASFRVAIRRSTRVGDRSGVLVEDLGVVPDEIHRMTKKDVLKNNVDLIERAGQMLAIMPVQAVTAKLQKTDGVPATVVVTTRNVTRLDVFVDDRPRQSLDVKDGDTPVPLPALPAGAHVLELRGFRDKQLVASTRLVL